MLSYEEMMENIKILLVDDDEDYLNVTVSFFKLRGYNIQIASSGEEAIKKLEEEQFHILLVDYFMPGISGEEVIERIRKTNKNIIVILQTGFAGQLPPSVSLKNLDIQNYHDKSEGIERLNLNVISGIKTFIWQNEILLKEYKNYAISNLITSIVNEVKSSLLSLSAGLEYSNILIKDGYYFNDLIKKEKINKYYDLNKSSLDKVDMMLTAVVNQLSEEKTEDIYKDTEIISLIKLILKNKLKLNGAILTTNIKLKTESYLKGHVNDVIFIICEIISKVLEKIKEISDEKEILLVLTEDDSRYIFDIQSIYLDRLSINEKYIFENVVMLTEKTAIDFKEEGSIKIYIKK